MEPMQLTTDASTKSNGRLAGKIAIVTGASSGIGRAISLRYAKEGATVVTSDVIEKSRNGSEEHPELTTAELIEKNGGTAIFVECNTTDEEAVNNLVKAAVEKFGRLDVIVNNAGIGPEAKEPAPIWSFNTEIFNRTMDVNTKGVAFCCRAAAAQMIKQDPNANGDRGHIVNLGSVFALLGSPEIVGYATSKHAVMGITRVAALDLAPHMVHVNAICPGYVKSAFIDVITSDKDAAAAVDQMHPFRGMGEPEDVARAAVVLASDDARWMTGAPLIVDGGYSAR